MVSHEHKHGHKNRCQDSPLGGTRRHEDINQCGHQNERNAHGQPCKANAFQEIGPRNRQQCSQLGPVKQPLELPAEEAEHHIGAHSAHLFHHGGIDIFDFGKFTDAVAIYNTGDREQEEQ